MFGTSRKYLAEEVLADLLEAIVRPRFEIGRTASVQLAVV